MGTKILGVNELKLADPNIDIESLKSKVTSSPKFKQALDRFNEAAVKGRAVDYDSAMILAKSYYFRTIYTRFYSFAFLTEEFMNSIADIFRGRNVLEVMAGSVYFSYCCKQRGMNVITTDNNDWSNGKVYWTWKNQSYFNNIEELDAVAAVEKYHGSIDLVVMSWPYMDNNAYLVAKACEKYGIDLLYIGEDQGGCTADDDFFDFIEGRDNTTIATDKFARFFGIYDFPLLIEFSKKK